MPKAQLEEIPALNLTPMIDVLFLLIIFFVAGTKFIESERQIELQVPRVTESTAPATAPERKVIDVFKDGQIMLDQKVVTLEQLKSDLSKARAQQKNVGVLVRGDGASAFQSVAAVLNTCKQAGIAQLGISVQLASTEKKANVRR